MLRKQVQCNIKRGGTTHWDWDKTPHILLACILPAAKIRVNYECMKEKSITEAAPPSTTQPQPMTLDKVLGPTSWLPRCWCGSAAALHPWSHTPRWGQASCLPCEADSKLEHVTRKNDGFTTAWDLSEEIKTTIKSSVQSAREAASLVHVCRKRSLGLLAWGCCLVWEARLPSHSTCLAEWAGGRSGYLCCPQHTCDSCNKTTSNQFP